MATRNTTVGNCRYARLIPARVATLAEGYVAVCGYHYQHCWEEVGQGKAWKRRTKFDAPGKVGPCHADEDKEDEVIITGGRAQTRKAAPRAPHSQRRTGDGQEPGKLEPIAGREAYLYTNILPDLQMQQDSRSCFPTLLLPGSCPKGHIETRCKGTMGRHRRLASRVPPGGAPQGVQHRLPLLFLRPAPCR